MKYLLILMTAGLCAVSILYFTDQPDPGTIPQAPLEPDTVIIYQVDTIYLPADTPMHGVHQPDGKAIN